MTSTASRVAALVVVCLVCFMYVVSPGVQTAQHQQQQQQQASGPAITQQPPSTESPSAASRPPLAIARRVAPRPRGGVFFTPRRMQATTSKGLKLFNHELPQTSGDSVLRVPLFKNWPLLADNSTAQGQGQGQGGKARRAANYVDVEPVDPAIRINVPHSCSRKAASAKHECFHAAFAAGQKLLIERVVSGLRLLPRSIRIPEHTRRFYYDLGSRSWESNSTRWFVENYPDSAKFSAEAYDMVGRFGATFPAEALRKHFAGGWRFVNSAVWIDSNGIQWDGSDMGAVVADGVHGVGGRSLAAASKAKAAAAERIPSFDLAKLLIERHGRREGAGAGAGSAASGGGDDFVVIKIDIEGAEWPIVERLIATGAVHVIDELFFECHIAEPAREMHPRCIDVINLFRRMGVVCHRWI